MDQVCVCVYLHGCVYITVWCRWRWLCVYVCVSSRLCVYYRVVRVCVCISSRLCVYNPVVQVEAVVDQVREKLLQVQGGAEKLEEKEKSELKKRKLLSEVYEPTLSIIILHIIYIFRL